MGACRPGALRCQRACSVLVCPFCRALGLSARHRAAALRTRAYALLLVAQGCDAYVAAAPHALGAVARASTALPRLEATGTGQALRPDETSALCRVVCDKLRADLVVATVALERARSAACREAPSAAARADTRRARPAEQRSPVAKRGRSPHQSAALTAGPPRLDSPERLPGARGLQTGVRHTDGQKQREWCALVLRAYVTSTLCQSARAACVKWTSIVSAACRF